MPGPVSPPEPALGELPDDVSLAWITGPSGSLRIAERHPEGSLAIVFIHGLGGRLELWSEQLRAFGPALRAIAVDLPGHGGSDTAADGDYSVPALASAIGAALDGCGLRRAVLVAHSLGALAAIEYAGRHPARVAGLLLVDPSGDQTRQDEAERQQELDVFRRDPDAELPWYFRRLLDGALPGVAELVLDALSAADVEALLGALAGATSYSPLAALDRYPGPVANLVTEFNASPLSLHRLRPELPVRRFYGVSHWLMMDRPDEVLETLWDLREALI